MADSFLTKKKSVTAFKGHYRRSAKAYDALLKVKPHATLESIEKAYKRVQKQLDSLLTALDDAITLLDDVDPADTTIEVDKETKDLNDYYDSLLAEQCQIETEFVERKMASASISQPSVTATTEVGSVPQALSSTRPSVRVTALEPPSWNGKKSRFLHLAKEVHSHNG